MVKHFFHTSRSPSGGLPEIALHLRAHRLHGGLRVWPGRLDDNL